MIVPGGDEDEDARGRQAGSRHRQDDLERRPERPGPAQACRLFLSVGTWSMKLAISRTDGGNPVAVAPRIKAQWVSSGPGLGNVSYIAIIESGTENAIAARKNGKRAFLSRDSNRELA